MEHDVSLLDLEQGTFTWNAKNVRLTNLQLRRPIWPTALAFLPDAGGQQGNKFVVGTAFKQMRLYDARTQRRPVSEVADVGEHGVTSILVRSRFPFSPHRACLAAWLSPPLRVVMAPSNEPQSPVTHGSCVLPPPLSPSLAWPFFQVTPDGNEAFVADKAGRIEVFDLRTMKPCGRCLGSAGSVRSMTMHPSLPYLAVSALECACSLLCMFVRSCGDYGGTVLLQAVGLDRTARVFNTKTKKLVHTSYLKQRLNAVLFDKEPVVKPQPQRVRAHARSFASFCLCSCATNALRLILCGATLPLQKPSDDGDREADGGARSEEDSSDDDGGDVELYDDDGSDLSVEDEDDNDDDGSEEEEGDEDEEDEDEDEEDEDEDDEEEDEDEEDEDEDEEDEIEIEIPVEPVVPVRSKGRRRGRDSEAEEQAPPTNAAPRSSSRTRSSKRARR